MKFPSSADIALKFLLVQFLCITPFMCSASSLSRPRDAELGFRVELRRIDGETSLAKRLQNAVERSQLRANHIATLINHASLKPTTFVESPVSVGDGEFLMQVGVGTPAVFFEAIVDTGSDLTWTQCLPCKRCFNQSTPIFDPSNSSTRSTIGCEDSLCQVLGDALRCSRGCSYSYLYGDGSTTQGDLGYETMTIGSNTIVPQVAFGCAHYTKGIGFTSGGGLVGLGRTKLSLISQLGDKVKNKFSYCLLPITEPPSKTSPMFFGDGADLSGAGTQTIPFIKNVMYPNFYYIPMTGITFNGSALDIPEGSFDIDMFGRGGMIIDSGTTLTYLPKDVYRKLKDAILLTVKLTPANASSVGMDLCYKASMADLEEVKVTFNFKGGVEYELPIENIFGDVGDGLLCLAITEVVNDYIPSILGNFQQQNFFFVYDNGANQLSFKPTQCNSF